MTQLFDENILREASVIDTMAKHDETKRVLDMLRRKRIFSGGSGKPLELPGGKEVSPIIITDEDLE